MPIAQDFPLEEMPHTLSFALIYRSRINSFYELPKDKRPPRNLWDKPSRLSEFFDDIFKSKDESSSESKTYIDINTEDVD